MDPDPVGSGIIIPDPDPNQNLIFQFVFYYRNISLENLKKYLKSIASVPLCTLKFCQFASWPGRIRVHSVLKIRIRIQTKSSTTLLLTAGINYFFSIPMKKVCQIFKILSCRSSTCLSLWLTPSPSYPLKSGVNYGVHGADALCWGLCVYGHKTIHGLLVISWLQ